MPQLPAWVAAFDKGPRIAQAVKEAGLDGPTTQFYELVGRTPAANAYELDFARALITNEHLGQPPADGSAATSDVLTISLSANDILGHQVGPDSEQEKAMVLALDRDLNSFFTWLDSTVGLQNVVVAFTADHGVAASRARSSEIGIASARVDLDDLVAALDKALNARLSAPGAPPASRHYLMPTQELPYLQLNPAAFGKLSERDAEQLVADALPAAVRSLGPAPAPPNNDKTSEATRTYAASRLDAAPYFAFIRTRTELANGNIPHTEFGELIAHSYTQLGGWYVMAFPGPYQMEIATSTGTTHFSPWSYDRHVPLGFYGAAFQPGYYREPVAPVDIAATLASLLGVNRPSAAVGHVLTFALKPAAQ
jgi:arylsulfatase A-like enzyme